MQNAGVVANLPKVGKSPTRKDTMRVRRLFTNLLVYFIPNIVFVNAIFATQFYSMDSTPTKSTKSGQQKILEEKASEQLKQDFSKYVVMTFAQGAYELTDEHKAEVATMLASADEGSILKVIVWADKPWLPDNIKHFTDKDKLLATERGSQLEYYIDEYHPVTKVEVFRMVESADNLAKAFSIKENELRSIFSKAKKVAQNKSSQGIHLVSDTMLAKDYGGAGKALLILK